MKTVKNSLYLIFVLSCFVMCRKPNVVSNKDILMDTVFIEKKDTVYIDNKTYINYEKDSIFYVFSAIVPSENYGDTFLVTKTIWVEDSCFGVSNKENWNKAVDFNFNKITYTYHISFLKRGIANNFFNITGVHYSREILLDKGYGNIYLDPNVKNFFLRVILKTEFYGLSQISLNYVFDDNLNPKFIYKERVHTHKMHSQDSRKIGYCLDTMYVVNEKEISWQEIVDTYAWRVCE